MRLRSVSRPCFARCCGVYAFGSRLIFISAQTQTHTHPYLNYTLYSHHRNANVLHFILFSADLGQVTNNSVTWNVSLPAYWTVQVSIEDANLGEGWSQPVRVLHHISPPPLPTLFFTHGILALYIQNHILDSSSTKQRCQLSTTRTRCPPQRSRVSINLIPQIIPHSLQQPVRPPYLCRLFISLFFPFFFLLSPSDRRRPPPAPHQAPQVVALVQGLTKAGLFPLLIIKSLHTPPSFSAAQ